MVLCAFYQNGSCKFGSRCHNDHMDIKTLIKQEIEAVVKGKQWPLSTFGPFKEKLSLTNFIEDMSFEEIRVACYEAQKLNNLTGHQMELMQMLNDANNKLQSMLTMSKEMFDQVVAIFNSPEEGSAPNNQTQKPANPFAANLGQSNMQGAPSNIFGGGFGGNQSSIFGGGSSSGGNIFSTQSQQQPSSGQNIFGMSSNFNQPQAMNQSSIFSSSSIGNTIAPPQASNIFSQPSATANVFQQQQPPQGNIFQQTPSTNIFQQAPQTQNSFPAPSNQNVFGSSPFVPAPQQAPTNIFNSQINPTLDTASASPFVQVAQQPSSLFAPTPTQMPFGGGSQVQQPQPIASLAQTQFNDSVYTKMDKLTKEQLDAFQANTFELGKIPTCPPPKELC